MQTETSKAANNLHKLLTDKAKDQFKDLLLNDDSGDETQGKGKGKKRSAKTKPVVKGVTKRTKIQEQFLPTMSCEHCKREFALKSSLMLHLKRSHPEVFYIDSSEVAQDSGVYASTDETTDETMASMMTGPGFSPSVSPLRFNAISSSAVHSTPLTPNDTPDPEFIPVIPKAPEKKQPEKTKDDDDASVSSEKDTDNEEQSPLREFLSKQTSSPKTHSTVVQKTSHSNKTTDKTTTSTMTRPEFSPWVNSLRSHAPSSSMTHSTPLVPNNTTNLEFIPVVTKTPEKKDNDDASVSSEQDIGKEQSPLRELLSRNISSPKTHSAVIQQTSHSNKNRQNTIANQHRRPKVVRKKTMKKRRAGEMNFN